MNGIYIVSITYLSMLQQIGRVGGSIPPSGVTKWVSLTPEWFYRFSVFKLPLSRFPLRHKAKKGLKAKMRNLCVK